MQQLAQGEGKPPYEPALVTPGFSGDGNAPDADRKDIRPAECISPFRWGRKVSGEAGDDSHRMSTRHCVPAECPDDVLYATSVYKRGAEDCDSQGLLHIPESAQACGDFGGVVRCVATRWVAR